MALTLRRITQDDEGFLYRVYYSTREEELARVPWTDEQKEAFVRMQFHAQHTFYMDQFGSARYDVVLMDDVPVGRLYVDRRDTTIRIIDIAILPEHRNRGIGSQLLDDLIAESERTRVPISIHVEKFNRALMWYQRLGFHQIEDQGVYLLMERQPNAAT